MNGMFAGRRTGWEAILVLTTLALPASVVAQTEGGSLADYLATTQLGAGAVTGTGTLDARSNASSTLCLTGGWTTNLARLIADSGSYVSLTSPSSGSLADYLGTLQQGSNTYCAALQGTGNSTVGALSSGTLRMNDGTTTLRVNSTLDGTATTVVRGGTILTAGNLNNIRSGGTLTLNGGSLGTWGITNFLGTGRLTVQQGGNATINLVNAQNRIHGGNVVLTNGTLQLLNGTNYWPWPGWGTALVATQPSLTSAIRPSNSSGLVCGPALPNSVTNLVLQGGSQSTLNLTGPLTINTGGLLVTGGNVYNGGVAWPGEAVLNIGGPPSLASAVRPGSASGVVCGPALPSSTSGTMAILRPTWLSSGLVKQGAGTLTLNRDDTYGGTTFVEGGTLRINANPWVIAPDATLALNGTGTLTGGITVSAGQVDISSALAVSGTTLTIGQPGTVVLASDLISGGASAISVHRAASVNAVPEPGSLALLGAATIAAFLLCRRRL
jgi:autotransporter-associated beta strand protein